MSNFSTNSFDKLLIHDNTAIAFVTSTSTRELWYDKSRGIFYRNHQVDTEKDVFTRTPDGWKLLVAAPIESKVENGDLQTVNGKLSPQEIAKIKRSNIDYSRLFDQIVIDTLNNSRP